MIQFEYQLTQHDVHELLFPPIDAKGRSVVRSPFRQLISRIVFAILLVVAVVALCLAQYFGLTLPWSATPPQPRPKSDLDNLWINLIPSVVPPLIIFAWAGLVQLLSSALVKPKFRKSLAKLFGMLLGLLPWGALWLMIDGPVIHWNATPQRITLITLGSWGLLGVWRVFRREAVKRRRSRMVWRTVNGLRRPTVLKANEQSLELIDSLTQCSYRWPYFKRFTETTNLYLLDFENGLRLGVPKRAFPDQADDLEFRRLLHEQVKVGTFLPTSTGFAVIPQPVQELQ